MQFSKNIFSKRTKEKELVKEPIVLVKEERVVVRVMPDCSPTEMNLTKFPKNVNQLNSSGFNAPLTQLASFSERREALPIKKTTTPTLEKEQASPPLSLPLVTPSSPLLTSSVARRREDRRLVASLPLTELASSSMSCGTLPEVNNVNVPLEQPRLQENELWTEKHRPASLKQVVGNNKGITRLVEWVREFKTSSSPPTPLPSSLPLVTPSAPLVTQRLVSSPVMLLCGPPGVGKTTSAHIVLKDAGYTVCEVNASDSRTAEVIYRAIIDTVTRKSLKNPTALILDEIDGSVSNFGDNKNADTSSVSQEVFGVQGITRFLAEYKTGKWPKTRPVICICNDSSSIFIRNLKKQCSVVRFFPPYLNDMKQVLTTICKKEKLRLRPEHHELFIEHARGDVRRLCQLLYLYSLVKTSGNVAEFLESSTGDEFDNIFESTKLLLDSSATDVEKSINLVASDSNVMFLMIEHNLLQCLSEGSTERIEEGSGNVDVMSHCYDNLTDCDILGHEGWNNPGVMEIETSVIGMTANLANCTRQKQKRNKCKRPAALDVKFTDYFSNRKKEREREIEITPLAFTFGVPKQDVYLVKTILDNATDETHDYIVSNWRWDTDDGTVSCSKGVDTDFVRTLKKQKKTVRKSKPK